MVRFLQNGEDIGHVQFPITEVGTSSIASFMIENNSEDNIELIFYSEDGDVQALEYPQHLKPRESKQAKLKFSCDINRPESLTTKWGFREIIG